MEPPISKQLAKINHKLRTCLIAAPSGTDLGAIKTLLQRKGLRPIVISELVPSNAPFLEQVKTTISRADLLLGVIDANKANENVYFEIGVAIALGKQVLILAPVGIKLPSDVLNLPHVRGGPENLEAIDFALDQTLASTRLTKQKRRRLASKTHAIGNLTDHLMHRLESLGDQASEAEIQDIIRDALRATGVTVVVQSQLHRGVDLAIWADELESWVGNPFVIEIKNNLRNQVEIDAIAGGLSDYLLETSLHWALVLYLQGPPLVSVRADSRILFMDIRRLLETLRTKSFAQIVLELRNERVHWTGR